MLTMVPSSDDMKVASEADTKIWVRAVRVGVSVRIMYHKDGTMIKVYLLLRFLIFARSIYEAATDAEKMREVMFCRRR